MSEWNGLSMRERASYIRNAVARGIQDVDEIRKDYHQYATGGNLYGSGGYRIPKNRKVLRTIKLNNGTLTAEVANDSIVQNKIYWFRNGKYITPYQMKNYRFYDSAIKGYRTLSETTDLRFKGKEVEEVANTPPYTPSINALETKKITNLKNSHRNVEEQTIPFKSQRIITLKTRGRMNLVDIPENLLDSIAVNAGRSNTDFWTDAALIGKESTFGGVSRALGSIPTNSPIDKISFNPYLLTNNHAYFVSPERDYLNALHKYNFRDEGELIQAENNAKYALEHGQVTDNTPHYSKYVLADAFKRYQTAPAKYNPNQSNYVPMVNGIIQELKGEQQLQDYWNTKGKQQYKRGQQEGMAYGGPINTDVIQQGYNEFRKGGNTNPDNKKQVFLSSLEQSLQNNSRYNTPQWRQYLTDLAFAESSFNPDSINNIGAKGYFQLMPANRAVKWDTPTQQFEELYRLNDSNMEYFKRNMTAQDRKKAQQLGIDIYGLIAGAHLGGARNALRALRGSANNRDANGTSVMNYMRRFSQTSTGNNIGAMLDSNQPYVAQPDALRVARPVTVDDIIQDAQNNLRQQYDLLNPNPNPSTDDTSLIIQETPTADTQDDVAEDNLITANNILNNVLFNQPTYSSSYNVTNAQDNIAPALQITTSPDQYWTNLYDRYYKYEDGGDLDNRKGKKLVINGSSAVIDGPETYVSTNIDSAIDIAQKMGDVQNLLPEVTVTGYRPIELRTYYPLGKDYPWTGHSQLIIPITDKVRDNYGMGVEGSFGLSDSPSLQLIIDKKGNAKDYNLVTNNCADATLGYLNTMFNTSESPTLFTTPGDVRDFAIEQLGGKVVSKDGIDTVLIPRNKSNANLLSTRAMEQFAKEQDDNYKTTRYSFVPSKKSNGGNLFQGGGGLFGNETVDTVASFLPIVGTLEDAYTLYKAPSWENAGWLALSLGSDLVGAGLLKGVKAATKQYKAAKATEKAAKEALDTHRKTTRNLIARSIREEDAKLVKAYQDSKANSALKNPFWDKVIEYPIYGGWMASDAGINAVRNLNKKADGGNLYPIGGPIINVNKGDRVNTDQCATWSNGLLRDNGYLISGNAWSLNHVDPVFNGFEGLQRPNTYDSSYIDGKIRNMVVDDNMRQQLNYLSREELIDEYMNSTPAQQNALTEAYSYIFPTWLPEVTVIPNKHSLGGPIVDAANTFEIGGPTYNWTRVTRPNGNYGYVRTVNNKPIDFNEDTGYFKVYDAEDLNSNFTNAYINKDASYSNEDNIPAYTLDEVMVTPSLQGIQRVPDDHNAYLAQQKAIDAKVNAATMTPERFLGLMGVNVPLAAGALGATVAAPALFNNAVVPFADYIGSTQAGQLATKVLTNPYTQRLVESGFAAHGLSHAINEGINGPVDAAITALEVVPMLQVGKPIKEAVSSAYTDVINTYPALEQYPRYVMGKFKYGFDAELPTLYRKVKTLPKVDGNKLVVSNPNNRFAFDNGFGEDSPIITNFTTDAPVRSHSAGNWDRGLTLAFPGKTLFGKHVVSTRPSDTFTFGDNITVPLKDVTGFTGRPKEINFLENIDVNTITSPEAELFWKSGAQDLTNKIANTRVLNNKIFNNRNKGIVLLKPKIVRGDFTNYARAIEDLSRETFKSPTLRDYQLMDYVFKPKYTSQVFPRVNEFTLDFLNKNSESFGEWIGDWGRRMYLDDVSRWENIMYDPMTSAEADFRRDLNINLKQQ